MAISIELLATININESTQSIRATIFDNAGRSGLIFAHTDVHADNTERQSYDHKEQKTQKISAFTMTGEQLWRHDVGTGILPSSLWTCPVYPFDLVEKGVDDIYFVGNSSQKAPLDKNKMELHRLSGKTGKLIDVRPWPDFIDNQSESDTFRYFIAGGYSHGKPRLITAQGTYHELSIHAWDAKLNLIWKRDIHDSEAGCRASHMISILDIDGDGRDEVFFGERCIDIDTGEDKWIADRDYYHGHSDIVMPTLDRATGKWSIYTCREFPWPEGSRGIVMFNDQGEEQWGYRGMGHVHDGWTARLGENRTHLCYAVEMFRDKKKEKEQGLKEAERFFNINSYLYDMFGNQLEFPFVMDGATPVDINGDGYHELVYRDEHPFRNNQGIGKRNGLVVDRHGNEIGRVKGSPGNLPRSKLLDCPGEQIMTYEAGTIRLFGCPDAIDSDEAKARYAHPYYKACQRLTAVGYNWRNLGGL